MPVVNREQERAIVQRALQRGMSQDQIKQAVTAYRSQAQPSVSSTSSTTPAQSEQKQPGGFQSFVQGVTTPFKNVATNIMNFAEGTANLVGAGIAGATGNEAKSIELQNKANEASHQSRNFGYFGTGNAVGGDRLTGNNATDIGKGIAQIIGTGAEVASYAAPVGIGKGAVQAGVQGVKSTLPALMRGGALAGAVGSGGAALAENKSIVDVAKATATGGLLGGVLGGAIPAASRTAGAVVSKAGQVGAEVLGRSTGAGEAAITQAFNDPNVIRYARQAGKEGPEGLMTQALEESQAALGGLKRVRAGEYLADLEKIKLDKTQLDRIVETTRNTARQLVGDLGVKFKEQGKLLNALNFADSTIERGQGTVQKAFNDVMRWTENTPAGLDKLQKKLSQHLDEIPVTERGGAFNFVLQLKNSVSNSLKASVPGYEQMTSRYREASDLIDEIQRALSLKDTASKDTAIRKLMSTMRQNNEMRREMLQTLGTVSGTDPVSKIAGASLYTKTPKGLAGTFVPYAGGIGGLSVAINPSVLPFLLLYLATASPRLVAEAVTLLAKVKGAKIIPPVVQQGLRNLLVQAANEVTTSDQPSTEGAQ